jgi:hypothetical protein
MGRVMSSDGKPFASASIKFDSRSGFDDFKTGSDGVFQLCSRHAVPGNKLTVSARIDDDDFPVGVVEVSREITEALTVIPIKVGAPPPVLKRP